MSGLTSEQKKERLKSIVTASQLYSIMGGYDDPPAPEPDRSFSELEPLRKHIEPLYEKGQRKFLCKDLNTEFEFKVSTDLINSTLAVIKYDLPAEIPEPVKTYAKKRVRENLFYDPDYDDVDTFAMRIGREREEDGMVELGKALGVSFEHTGADQIHRSRDGVGSTPDGIRYNSMDLMDYGGEIKCFAPDHHIDCCIVVDQTQLREDEFEIFCQTQGGMYSFNLQRWHAGFYNPHSNMPELKFQHVQVEPDVQFVKVMLERVAMVRDEMELRFNKIDTAIAAKQRVLLEQAA